VTVLNNGTLYLYNGEISGNTVSTPHSDYMGGGVIICRSATFIMSGGKITGNIVNYGGGVYNSDTVTRSSGEISGNTALKWGGGVYHHSAHDFVMSEGTIANNTAEMSTDVHIVSGSFYREGGVISDNIDPELPKIK
jgi:hypothetical protein